MNRSLLSRKAADRRPVIFAGLTLLLGLALTAFAVFSSQKKINEEAWYRFSLQFNRLDASVRGQLLMPLPGLQGLVGLQNADGKLDTKAFTKWVAAQDFEEQARGVIAYGFMERMAGNAGAPDRFVVSSIEPFQPNRAMLGLDAGADPALRDTLMFVISTGEPSVTAIPGDPDGAKYPSQYLLVSPLYKPGALLQNETERRAALAGLLFARIDLNSLLLPSVSVAEGLIEFQLADGAERAGARMVFASSQAVSLSRAGDPPADLSQRHFHNRRGLVIGGKLLYLQAATTATFMDQIDNSTPPVVGLTGSLLSLLLAMIFWLNLDARRRAESIAHAMTRDLDRLAHIAQSTSHVVFMVSAEHTVSWVNQAFCTFTGVELDEAVGRPIEALLSPDTANDPRLDPLRAAITGRTNARLQTPIKSRRGVLRWFDIDLQIERDADADYDGYIVIAADITAQREAALQEAAALRDKKSLLDAIDLHSIVSITDPAGNITYANEMFSQISGYSHEELIGKNHRLVKSEVQSDDYWASMWKTISSGYSWRDTVCNRAKDGRMYWVDTVIAPFFDADGNIEKYISIRADVTQARLAQAQIREDRAHLKAIIEGTNAGTWEWEVESGRNIVNARWAEILGYKLEDLGPITLEVWRSLCHPDDLSEPDAMFERYFNGTDDYFEREFRMRHRDGHWLWVQSRGKVTSWLEPGKPQWVSGIHLDITAQKNLQAELHQNNRVMQSILDNIPVALSVFDSELRLVAHNDLFRKLLQFPASLFAGPVTTFESLIRFNAERGEYGSGDVEETVRTTIERARNTTAHQFERDRPDGTALEVRGGPMPGGGFITTYADISKRRQADAEVVRTTRMLQSVLDAASEVAVVTIGLDGLIGLFNVGAVRMLGYAADEVIGLKSPELFFDRDELQARGSSMSASLGRDVKGLDCLIDSSVLGKRCEWTYVHKDGHRFAAALVVTAMTNPLGQTTGYLAVSHDITQEKQHAQQLQIAMEEAELASTAKSQFLANMSHEIRTPMNAILGMLKLLQNTPLDARQQDYTTKTESAARSLLGLLNDILDFSKAEAGKMVLDPQPFALDRLMRDLSVILSANVGRKGLEVVFELDPKLPRFLVGDSLRLQQVLINLGGNAIKFTEEGEVVVSVSLLQENADSVRLRVAVRDSGIGIDPKNQKHIFAGFSQAEASTTRRFGGTGLGLSICKRLVSLMGGELQLQSALGAGSTFSFAITMPLAPEPENDNASAPAPLAGDVGLPVLVVDDNAIARSAIATSAASWGWQVEAVAGVHQALAWVQSRGAAGLPLPQAIFLDWHLPDMDGWEAKRQLREFPPLKGTPIVVMSSAQAREGMADHPLAGTYQWESCVVKPVTASMLRDGLMEARSHHERQVPAQQRRKSKVQRLRNIRLLVVEDNLINQQVAKELLMSEGALITLASNGQLGVEAVAHAQPPFDAVLMDIQMPVMDGYTASVTIRHELGLHELPIIAMTANAMASDREACLASGMNDHIGKPFDLNQLVDMLRHYVKPSEAMPEDATCADVEGSAQNEASEPEQEQDKPAISASEFMDIDSALQMLEGNEDLYNDIARAYLSEIDTFAQQIPVLLQKVDPAEAIRSLHTIKGLSLTVGAKGLSEVCRHYERELKAMQAGGTPLLPEACTQWVTDIQAKVGDTHAALTKHIAPPEPRSTSPDASKPVNYPELLADLQMLRGLLAQSNMQALDIHAILRKNHGESLGSRLEALKLAMDTFDFAQGMVQCDELISECIAITKP